MTIDKNITEYLFQTMDDIKDLKDSWIKSVYFKMTGNQLPTELDKECLQDFDISTTNSYYDTLETSILRYKGEPCSIFILTWHDGQIKYKIEDYSNNTVSDGGVLDGPKN